MGNMQSGNENWNINDLVFGTAANAVTTDEVVAEVSKLPAKYFGGEAIENDASMHQLHNDLLSFDESIKRIFRRKKTKQSQNNLPAPDEYDYEDQESMPTTESTDTMVDQNYLKPTFLDRNIPLSSISVAESMNDRVKNTHRIIWRCTNCTAENKITESACRRCGLAETKL
ncbi:unnamed protein product [Rotaria socialis]|uniref:RanBP2-type domain-containing protein n=2 Tax=Rotaria socialis TaxID=392032 RepID=A0A817RP51_9BILA|nr:unnamed protein product [Rotaria socialis]CAF3358417.1 unnamed protein product [Rotaria socialis]CAF4167581.1 unnamed protein product [Rotaria socialis]CAF4551641.1 unnamed protein product [Rotaria socialis]